MHQDISWETFIQTIKEMADRWPQDSRERRDLLQLLEECRARMLTYKEVHTDSRPAEGVASRENWSEARSLFMAVIQATNNMVVVTDMAGTILTMNEACAIALGLHSDDAVGEEWYRYFADRRVHEEIMRTVEGLVSGAIRWQPNTSKLIDIRTAAGGRRSIVWRLLPVPTVLSEVQALLWTGDDITELRRLESKMKIQSSRFQRVLEHVPVGIFFFDPSGHITGVNPKFADIIGSSSDVLQDMDLLQLPDVRVVGAIQAALQGETGTAEGIYRSVTGRKSTPGRLKCIPSLDEQGRVTGGMGIVEDLTDHVLVESELKESEEKFRTLAEGLEAAVFIERDHFLYVNPAMEKLTGYGFDDLQRMQFNDIVERDDKSGLKQEMCEPPAGADRRGPREIQVRTRSGEIRWVEILSRTIHFRGAPARLVTLFDITSRKKAETVLKLRLGRLQALYYLTRHLGHADRIEAVLDYALETLIGSIGADACTAMLCTQEGFLKCRAWRGLSALVVCSMEGLQPWDCPDVVARPLIYEDIRRSDLPEDSKAVLLGEDLRSLASFPVLSGSTLLGVLIAYFKVLHRFTGEERQLGQTIAGHVALAIDKLQSDAITRASEERYGALVSQASDGIFILDLQGNILESNESGRKLLGTNEVLAEPLNVASVVDQKDQKQGLRVLAALKSGHVVIRELMIRNLAGKIFPVEISAKRFGEQYVQAIVRDITERKKAEEARQATLSLLSATLESTTDGILVVDLEGHIVAYNAKFLQMWNLSEEIVKIRKDRVALEAVLQQLKDPDGFLAKVEKLYASPEAESFDVLEFIDGRIFERYSQPQRIEGRTVGRVWSFRDVTEQYRIRQEKERLAAILEATTDLVFVTDPQGHTLYVNKAGLQTLGFSEDKDPSEIRLGDLFPAGVFDRIRNAGVDVDAREAAWSGETSILHADGRRIPLSLVILAHRDRDGRMDYYSMIARDISERKDYEATLIYLADHDSLTDLLNRRRFQEKLEYTLAQSRRFGTSGALMLIDLDDFKMINDTLGHHAGDDLLISLANLMRNRVRETDLIARVGGDEFAILLPHTSADRALQVAQSIVEAFKSNPSPVHGSSVQPSASIGIAVYPDHGDSVEALMARADLAMYCSKEKGRGSITQYSPAIDRTDVISKRLSWYQRLRTALDSDRFVFYCQPILDLEKHAVTHYELLLRLMELDGDVVLPGRFLDVALQLGLIREIDMWVVRHAIRLLASPEHAYDGICVNVNLSPRAFMNEDLENMVRKEVETFGIDPRRVTFEITERAAISNMAQAKRFVQNLKGMGFLFAIDDFGAGFSAFSYLRYLPIDFIKIDGSYILRLVKEAVDRQLVRAIVDLAHGLGKRVIAEFVSDDATMDILRTYGVDFVQGAHIGMPADLETAFGSEPGHS